MSIEMAAKSEKSTHEEERGESPEKGLSREDMENLQLKPGEVIPLKDFQEDVEVTALIGKGEKRGGDERGQDMVIADRETSLVGVLDGAGGMGNGDAASVAAALAIPKHYKEEMMSYAYLTDVDKHKDGFIDSQTVFASQEEKGAESKRLSEMWDNAPLEVRKEMLALRDSVKAANKEVRESGGVATITVGKTVETSDGSRYEVVANAGDCGAFVRKTDGSVVELTKEDSFLDFLVSKGAITPEMRHAPIDTVVDVPAPYGGAVRKKAKLGKDESITLRDLRQMMTNALGAEDPVVSVNYHRLESGDSVVYMTDGMREEILNDKGLFSAERAAMHMEGSDSKDAAEALYRYAHSQNMKKDDKAMIVKEYIESMEDLEMVEEDDEEELSDDDIEIIENAA